MFNNNSISIPVSDEETDEIGRMRARVRRKRKKLPYRGKNELVELLLRKLVKYWMLLIIIPAAGLLLFEASRIGTKPSSAVNAQRGTSNKQGRVSSELSRVDISKPTLGKDPPGNLNRLDPTTRVIGGVRERCLKILSPEELERLDIPMEEESSSPVEKVLYISESGTPIEGVNTTLSQQHTQVTRFNLFTGNQTLDQREKSFEVKGTTAVHCGFYSVNGGFKISEEDKSYMQACKVVVSTCAFGGGDDLYQPIGMSNASLQKWYAGVLCSILG